MLFYYYFMGNVPLTCKKNGLGWQQSKINQPVNLTVNRKWRQLSLYFCFSYPYLATFFHIQHQEDNDMMIIAVAKDYRKRRIIKWVFKLCWKKRK